MTWMFSETKLIQTDASVKLARLVEILESAGLQPFVFIFITDTLAKGIQCLSLLGWTTLTWMTLSQAVLCYLHESN